MTWSDVVAVIKIAMPAAYPKGYSVPVDSSTNMHIFYFMYACVEAVDTGAQ